MDKPVDKPQRTDDARAMWGYALIWFLFNDMVKMLTYRVLRERRA